MSSNQTALIRQVIAIAIVGTAGLLLAIQFTRMVEPAAAREVQAACNGLRPAAQNPTLGALPTSKPIDFTAIDYTGKQVSLSDFRGKIVFVNFWATWCGVCESEKPGLDEMAREFQREYDDFVVLTLASDPSWEKIRAKYPEGAGFQVLLDPPANEDDNLGVIARKLGLTAVPESFVVDREGKVRYYFINKRDWNSDVAHTCLRALADS